MLSVLHVPSVIATETSSDKEKKRRRKKKAKLSRYRPEQSHVDPVG
jgi:hypothetical protein